MLRDVICTVFEFLKSMNKIHDVGVVVSVSIGVCGKKVVDSL